MSKIRKILILFLASLALSQGLEDDKCLNWQSQLGETVCTGCYRSVPKNGSCDTQAKLNNCQFATLDGATISCAKCEDGFIWNIDFLDLESACTEKLEEKIKRCEVHAYGIRSEDGAEKNSRLQCLACENGFAQNPTYTLCEDSEKIDHCLWIISNGEEQACFRCEEGWTLFMNQSGDTSCVQHKSEGCFFYQEGELFGL
jgi:hypothetical protein